MKRALKIIGGITAVVLLAMVGIAVYVYQTAIEPSRPVGFQQLVIADPGHPSIAAGVWYPTTAKPGFVLLGTGGQRVATGGPVEGYSLPMVVISHGTAGSAASHADTAIALAEKGFIVIAPTHPDDTFEAASHIESWLTNRTRHIQMTIDAALNSWKDRRHIDPGRIGIFGFSAGATTALVAISAKPDLRRISTECGKNPEFICKTTSPDKYHDYQMTSWPSDRRIRAAVLAAPGLGFVFDSESLSGISIPVQIWAGTADDIVPLKTNSEHLSSLLGSKSEMHAVPGADHFSFLMPCGLLAPRELCMNPEGFDRKKFHQELNENITRFFISKM